MKNGWTEKSIDDLAFVGRGRSRHRPRNDPMLYGGEHPFVQTADIHNADLWITTYKQTYNDKGLAQSRPWKPGTICITNAGENTGDCAILGIEACFPDSVIAVVADESKSDPVFLKYAIDRLKPRLRTVTKGATQDNLSVAKLTSFRFPTPPVEQQRKIGRYLQSYGELIENNRRRIQLLEQAARLLYKEWFIHLRFPGHEHIKVADGVPDEWSRVPFSSVVDFREGPGLRNHQYRDHGIPFLNIRTFSNDEIDLAKTNCLDETEVAAKYQHFLLEEDDHVVSSSGTLGRLVTIRRCHLPLMLNTSLIRMRPVGQMKKWFLKAYLKYGDFIDQAHSMATGAAQLNYGPSHLNAMSVIIPNQSTMELFEDHIGPIYEQIKALLNSNLRLVRARDIILPRLMNGEIPV